MANGIGFDLREVRLLLFGWKRLTATKVCPEKDINTENTAFEVDNLLCRIGCVATFCLN